MATLTLISVNDVIYELGVRSLVAYVRSRGHDVRLVFLGQDISEFTEARLEPVVELASDSDLIGVSLLSHSHAKAVQLTTLLKSRLPAIPILWGGIHATGFVEESLEHADIVCVGEGEQPLAELLEHISERTDFRAVDNLCFMDASGNLVRNPVRPPERDLDSLPFQDYSLADEYIDADGELKRMDADLLRRHLLYYPFRGMGHVYVTMGSRGCPFDCTFCCNNVWHNLYGRGVGVRKRSVDNLVREIEEATRRFPFIKMIMLEDDSFLFRTQEEIEQFASIYARRVGLPFGIEINPNEISRPKLEALKTAGLALVHVGIQSADESIRKRFYNRHGTNDRVYETNRVLTDLHILHKYDIIVDTPFPGDAQASLEMLRRFRGLFSVNLYSLRVYPGLAIEKIMREAGYGDWLEANDTSVSYEEVLSSEAYAMALKRWVPFPPTRASLALARLVSRWPRQFHWAYKRLGGAWLQLAYNRLGGHLLTRIYRRLRLEVLRLGSASR